MNYTTNVDVPTAYITRKKSRLKVYGQNVFLSDGESFEIELYNPKPRPVLAKIKLNGDYISTSSGIIINPGQRVFLERFLDSNNKFKYKTYNVENTPQNKSAIASNGDVIIEFYDKQDFITFPHLTGGCWINGWNGINTGTPMIWNNGTEIISNTTNTINFSNSNTSYSNIGYTTNTSSIETGRVEKGSSSNQTFEYSNDNFSSYVSKQYIYKILPYGQKNKTVNEIRQYCTECGAKVKNNFKFCPSCGNKI